MPVFSDFLIMVNKMAGLAIASPRMVQMATGQKVDVEELGGAEMHATKSGSVHFVAENEEEAAAITKQLLSYLPDSFDAPVPEQEPVASRLDPANIDNIIPQDPNQPYDVHELIDSIVDGDSFLEVKADYAKELVVGFARLNGKTIGVVANQPAVRGGAIFPESSEKGAEF